MRRRLLLAAAASAPVQAAGVRVMAADSDADQRYDFPQRLIALLLASTGLGSRLEPVPGLDQREVAAALARGELDLGILPTVGVRNPDLHPVRWPIRRGLLGARLLLALPAQAARLRRVTQLAPLKREFRLGYGADWHDLPQMRELGFRITGFTDYRSMFVALARGEVDYLHRGVNEVWAELDHPLLVPQGIEVVPDIALSYPIDDYLYLGPQRQHWRPRLQAGLQQLWRSGAYQSLFFDSFGRSLQRAGFAKRRVLPLIGYGVEPGTPVADFDALTLHPTRARPRLPA